MQSLSVKDLMVPKDQYDRVRGSRTSSKAAARTGSARLFIDSQEKDVGLWSKPLTNLIEKASSD